MMPPQHHRPRGDSNPRVPSLLQCYIRDSDGSLEELSGGRGGSFDDSSSSESDGIICDDEIFADALWHIVESTTPPGFNQSHTLLPLSGKGEDSDIDQRGKRINCGLRQHCSICQKPFQADDRVAQLPMGRKVLYRQLCHERCILEWYAIRRPSISFINRDFSIRSQHLKPISKHSLNSHQAAALGELGTLKDIVRTQGWSEIFKKDHNGWNPLHKAARGGHADVLEYLLSKGAYVNERTNFYKGGNALYWAQKNPKKNSKAIAVLEEYGAIALSPDNPYIHC